MIALGRKIGGGPVDQRVFGDGWSGTFGSEEFESVSGAEFKGAKRDGDVELFVQDVALADDGFDEVAVLGELVLEKRVLGFDNTAVQKFDVIGDVFLFGD